MVFERIRDQGVDLLSWVEDSVVCDAGGEYTPIERVLALSNP
jgi:hypothetical protein